MKALFPFVFIFLINQASAQFRVSGTVIEAESKAVVAGATVYINNSTIRTSTNKEGQYNLRVPEAGNYELVISALGHELVALAINVTGETTKNVTLQQKSQEIEEVTVSAYLKDGWQQWGAYFTESFIGTSKFAKQTKILNPQVLRFRYSSTQKTLQVSATEPLQITNRALGYNIVYDLHYYSMDFNNQHLYYEGFASFQDVKKISAKTRRNRKEAYGASLMRFIRSTYTKSWNEDGYEVRELERVVNQERQRVDSIMKTINNYVYRDLQGSWTAYHAAQHKFNPDSIQYFRKILNQPKVYEFLKQQLHESQIMTDASTDGMKEIRYNNYLHIQSATKTWENDYFVWNRKADGSSLLQTLPDATIWIDALGNFSPAPYWIQEGYWAWYNKLCNMLPLEDHVQKLWS